ncbi:chromate transporter [Ramlibacter alkalitolerans]|jgi:chromate transporter|uniref:Chromate transporter n=1 Tax=Ramlibacter alkalitolerans TaxID=2039631 RepID=A0ABS1JLG7_9BURK|nr:chromate transporter [Ramlibacter alkalitolerans]MBL0425080.1 chromate transporter [Ramlibacter alkalitolerans]
MSSTFDGAADAPPLARPRSRTDLFISFTLLALQGFGGVLAVVQRELVENKRWMTREEFIEEWAVAQIMPGPNVINLSISLGSRYFGFTGALAAVAGLITFPLGVLLALALFYAQYSGDAHMVGAVRGMGAVAAGLITATGLKLMPALKRNVLGVPLSAALGVLAFVAIAWLKLPLLWVLLALGGVSCVLAFRKLA